MDVINSIREYINKMLGGIEGMKVLVLDRETKGIVSMVYTQSEILQKEVFLFENIESPNKEEMLHMKAVYFIRPTNENISFLEDALKSPRFNRYHLFFTNTINSGFLDQLAKSDDANVVAEVQEFFGDFFAVNPDVFTLNITGVLSKKSTSWGNYQSRIIDGILSSILALKKRPTIRYSTKSDTTKFLAEKIADRMNKEKGLFDYRTKNESLLLILDRKDDPITPLLHQWTYQAMIHELLGGIKNNRISLPSAKGDATKDLVISYEHDAFYKENLTRNFGDLGVKIKELVDQYQEKFHTTAQIKSIEDMKQFITNYPNFQKCSSTASKHVSIMDELSTIVSQHSIMDVSEIQQELACNDDHSPVFERMMQLFNEPNITERDKLVLALLYCIRYESKVWQLKQTLSSLNFSPKNISLIDQLLMYAGSQAREGDLLGTKSIFVRASRVVKGLQGISNIYTQHKPLLNDILESFVQNKLSDKSYPFLTMARDRPTDVIIFIAGGITFEEALTVETYNQKFNGQFKFVLGGTSILNCDKFLDDLENIKK